MNEEAGAVTVETPTGVFRMTSAGGLGRPLVLIHGWGGQARQWQGVTPFLARHYRVFAIDMPGGPAGPLTGRVSMEALGNGVAACLTAAALPPVILLGHSMGGPVMVEAALAAPKNVCGLLGLDTLADVTFYGGADTAEIATRRAMFGADVPGETRRMVANIVAPDTSGAVCDAITADILTARAEDLLDLRDAMFAWQAEVRVPLVEVALRLLNSRAVEAAHRINPMSSLADVPQSVFGAGHFPQLEAPEQIAAQLIVELDQL